MGHVEGEHHRAGQHPSTHPEGTKGGDATDAAVGEHIWRWCPTPTLMLAPAKTKRKTLSLSLLAAETIAKTIPQAMAKPMLYAQ